MISAISEVRVFKILLFSSWPHWSILEFNLAVLENSDQLFNSRYEVVHFVELPAPVAGPMRDDSTQLNFYFTTVEIIIPLATTF